MTIGTEQVRRNLIWGWICYQLLGSFVSAADGGCTLCWDGTPVTSNRSFPGGFSCAAADQAAAATPANMSLCNELRLQGYLYCGCPTYPPEYCFMCTHGNHTLPFPRRNVPWIEISTTTTSSSSSSSRSFANSPTCQDILYTTTTTTTSSSSSSNTTDGHCQEIQRAEYFCGCPGAVRSDCYLCGNATLDAALAYPQRVLPVLPGISNTSPLQNCSQIREAASLFNNDTCLPWLSSLSVDVTTYCGCPGAPTQPAEPCSLCGSAGTFLANLSQTVLDNVTGLTCGGLANWTKDMASGSPSCRRVQGEWGRQCCAGVTAAPSRAPSMAPLPSAPTGGGSSGAVTEAAGRVPWIMFVVSWAVGYVVFL